MARQLQEEEIQQSAQQQEEEEKEEIDASSDSDDDRKPAAVDRKPAAVDRKNSKPSAGKVALHLLCRKEIDEEVRRLLALRKDEGLSKKDKKDLRAFIQKQWEDQGLVKGKHFTWEKSPR